MAPDSPATKTRTRPATAPNETLRFHGRRLVLARAAWILITVAALSTFIAGVPLRYRQLLTPCAGSACADGQLTPEAILALQEAGYRPELYAAVIVGASILVALPNVAVGMIIFWRKSREWMAWSASLWLITFGVTLFEGEVRALADAVPWLTAPVQVLILLGGVILLALFFLTFPNGRFVPRWSRWIYPLAVILFLAHTFVFYVVPSLFPAIEPVGYLLWGSMVLGGVAAQIYRYARVSGPIERQQTKWIMFGLLALLPALGMFMISRQLVAPLDRPALAALATYALEVVTAALSFVMIPITLAFSLLRYRLWDTDIIINRALVYGLLTAVLALLYFGSVVLLQQLLQALTGHQSPLAVVASTLLTAALFSPLRRRLQTLIDRRFYRRKYDAAMVLNRFARVAQDEVDLNHLADALLAAVRQTMQPDAVSLWLSDDPDARERRSRRGTSPSTRGKRPRSRSPG